MREYQEELETRKALEELGRRYLTDMPEALYELRSQISEAMVAEDGSQLLVTAISKAHQIKGTAGSLSFPALSRMAAEIEVLLKGVNSCDKASDRKPMAMALLVVTAIESWLEDRQDSNAILSGQAVAGALSSSDYLPEICDQSMPRSMPESISESVPQSPVESLSDSGVMSEPQCLNLSDQVQSVSERVGAKRAYIVDSDPERVQILANVLRSQGNWLVETIAAGTRLLSAVEECQPELLILDEAGDKLGGVDVCRIIRCHSKWASLPIVVLTSDTSASNRRYLYLAGVTDFIIKPLVPEELAQRFLGLFSKAGESK